MDAMCKIWQDSASWLQRRCRLKMLTTDGRRTTTDGRRIPAYTISSPMSLRLRWAKNLYISLLMARFYIAVFNVANLFDNPGISRFRSQHVVSVESSSLFHYKFICDLFISVMIHRSVRKPSHGPNNNNSNSSSLCLFHVIWLTEENVLHFDKFQERNLGTIFLPPVPTM